MGFGRDADLDFVAFDADFEGIDFDLWVVAPFAVVNAEPPGVPGAGDDAGFEVAAGERGAHVRAEVVDGGEFSVLVEDGDHAAVHGVGLALAGGDVAQFGDGHKWDRDEVRHTLVRFLALRSVVAMLFAGLSILGARAAAQKGGE
jgi:hypothetical protein